MEIFNSLTRLFAKVFLEDWGFKKYPKVVGNCLVVWCVLHLLIAVFDLIAILVFFENAHVSIGIIPLAFLLLGAFFVCVGRLICQHK